MHLVPGLIEVLENFEKTALGQKKSADLLGHKWGLNVQNQWAAGLFDENFRGLHVGVLGCVACHSGKAAGQYIIGLGNKNIDVLQIGKDATLIEKLYQSLKPLPPANPAALEVRDSALSFAKLLSNSTIGNLTQGLVPVAFIRSWFYRQAGLELPPDMTRGAVKIPFLWGYGEKKSVGQFSDGFGDGTFPGWAVAVELTAGQEPSTVRSYLPKIEAAEDLFSDFLPPKYPFSINSEKAALGKDVFLNTCARCHGTYNVDEQNLPVYQAPRWIDLEVVKTDSDRLEANTDKFQELVAQNPLNDIIKSHHFGRGYFAPRLVGVWSRFPYLHNGAIPNIASLLTPPENRPKIFSVWEAGEFYRFDQDHLGLTVPAPGTAESEKLAASSARWIYKTDKVGQSNQGHPFGTKLSDDEKQNLLEYLKTL